MLNYEFPPLGGGAGNATYYLLNEFSKPEFMDLEMDLVTSSADKFKIQNFSKNITIHFLNINKKGSLQYQSNKDLLTYSFKAYRYSKSLMKKKHFDLCHAFFGIPCGYIAMKLKLPYIVSLRGSDVPYYNKRFYYLDKFFFERLSRKIWKKARYVVANSKGLRTLALKAAPNQKILVISNGIDVDAFKPGKASNDKLTLISTGRLISRKGYQFLLPALEGLPVKLKLIGDGNMFKELKELAKKHNVDVSFMGKKEHSSIPKYLQEADVFILPSLNEGMSNSVLEAMACGLPVIVTNVGGSQELIKGNGFIVEKGNIVELRKAIEKYLDNPKLIKQHSIESRKIAEQMSWHKVAEDYKRLYDELA